MVHRDISSQLIEAAGKYPAIVLTGPCHSGKTTLCRSLFPEHPYANLVPTDMRAFARDDPRSFLAHYPQGAVLDGVHLAPELFGHLKATIDEDPRPRRWILTGFDNPGLRDQLRDDKSAWYELHPLTRGEITRFPRHPVTLDESLLAGSYPRIFENEMDPAGWLHSYVRTYVERDFRAVERICDLSTFRRFVALCAARTAQLLNISSLASACGIKIATAKAWLGILEDSRLVFRLPERWPFRGVSKPWNQAQSDKLYFYDTGLVCQLLGIGSARQLGANPLRGFIFETWVVSEIAKRQANRGEKCGIGYFHARGDGEINLVVEEKGRTVLVQASSAVRPSAKLLRLPNLARKFRDRDPDNYSTVAVYGGDQLQITRAGSIVPWSQLHRLDWGGSASTGEGMVSATHRELH